MESRYRTRTNPSLLLLNLKQLLMRKLSSFVVLFLTALKGMCAFAQAPANFTYYFQILCLLGFIRTGAGAPIGDVVYSTALTGLMNLRPDLELAIRELYGYSVIFGVGVLVLIALSRFKRQIYSTVPLLESIFMAAARKWNLKSFARKGSRSHA